MTYSSNLTAVFAKYKNNIIDPASQNRVLKAGALNLLALISERIQQRGENTGGRGIEADYAANRAQGKRKGAYSAGHYYQRKKRGRQTGKMDLTDSGKMLDIDFTVFPVPGGWAVGFITDGSAQKMEWLEEIFGADIVKPSESEINDSYDIIVKNIQDVIKRNN